MDGKANAPEAAYDAAMSLVHHHGIEAEALLAVTQMMVARYGVAETRRAVEACLETAAQESLG